METISDEYCRTTAVELSAWRNLGHLINSAGLPVETVEKAQDGSTQIVDLIRGGQIQLALNTPLGSHAHMNGVEIRKAAIELNVPLLTTLSAAMAAVSAIQALGKKELRYRSLQSHFGER